MKLNLGCGHEKKEGFINIDKEQHDLNEYPYPWKDVDYILAAHIAEHLDEPINFIQECHKILKSNGILELTVPHYSSPLSASPQHKTYWSVISLAIFLQDNETGTKEQSKLFKIKRIYLKILFIGWIKVTWRLGLILENFIRIEEIRILLVKEG